MGDGELQDAGERDAKQAQQDTQVDAKLLTEDADALGAAEQAVELIKHANAAAGERGEGGAGDAQFWERSPAEDEARVENEVDDVGDPQQTHGDGRVTSTAEDGIVEEKHHDRAASGKRNARIAGTGGDDLRGGAHQA